MTKHWDEQSLLAPPAHPYLGARHHQQHHDHHLDASRNAHHSYFPSSIARPGYPAQHWPYHSPTQVQVPVRPPPPRRLEKPAAPKHLATGTTTHMDKAIPSVNPGPTGPSSCPIPTPRLGKDAVSLKEEAATGPDSSRDRDREKSGGRKKNYQRYPKPPYSYLAMIAMVIQNSPEKKLTLSEILKEISTLFPFFKGNYKGWRDSVRHNLSSYDCFVKVLKDPGKPQGKGNFWAVEVSRVPLELLKRQNTAVSRQDETVFAQDLAPYILHGGHGHKPDTVPPPVAVASLPPRHISSLPAEDPYRPKLDSSFAIDSLLHSLRPPSAASEAERAARDCWGVVEYPRPSPPPRPRYTSSARSASASSASPASSSSDEDWRAVSQAGKRFPPDGEAGPRGYEDCRPPLHKSARRGPSAAPWELPTSYAKYTPPNAVAPPSMRFNGGPLLPLHGGLPIYSYGGSPVAPGHFVGHAYWPLLPGGRVAIQPPPLIMDLDSMLQSVPPNKSVFDVLGAANQTLSHHQPPSQYARYPQY